MSENESALSASRIKTLQQCSWTYWCKYKLKLPDSSNDGASRGWICHLILELLGHPKHKSKYDLVVSSKTLYACASIKKLVLYHAKKLKVNDDENLNMIDEMTINGLNYDFFGNEQGIPDESISEKAFDISVKNGDLNYRIKGFIDKLFLYKKKSYALIRDFKSSKQVFKGKDASDNLQNLMYSLATKILYPEYTDRQSEFIFLKFDLNKDLLGQTGKGVMLMDPVSELELSGLEYELTNFQNYINNFSEEHAQSNFAAKQSYPSDGSFGGPLACGKDGFKMRRGEPLLDESGQPIKAFICSFRKPFKYYALKDSQGNVLKTVFEEDESLLIADFSKGETIELMEYEGCPHWYPKSTNSYNDFLDDEDKGFVDFLN